MLMWPGCVPCIDEMISTVAARLLDDEPALAGKSTFILFGKCDPLCGAHAAERGELIVFNH